MLFITRVQDLAYSVRENFLLLIVIIIERFRALSAHDFTSVLQVWCCIVVFNYTRYHSVMVSRQYYHDIVQTMVPGRPGRAYVYDGMC